MADRRSVDLHLHSSVSDGTDTPTELVAAVKEAGVGTMALVDHDILGGIEDARTAARAAGIEFIAGTELSVNHGSVKMHMLVYFLEPGSGPLQDRLAWLREGRRSRNAIIVERLNELGYEITLEDVRAHAGGDSVGRPQIADALVAAGYFGHRDDTFDDLLGDGGAAYVERQRLSASEAIELARAAGAVPVIAHPSTMSLNAADYGSLFRELVDEGLGGIEAQHPRHPPDLRVHLTEIAEKLGVAATGGSDYHGTGKRGYRIGTGKGDLKVPYSAVESLRAQRGG